MPVRCKRRPGEGDVPMSQLVHGLLVSHGAPIVGRIIGPGHAPAALFLGPCARLTHKLCPRRAGSLSAAIQAGLVARRSRSGHVEESHRQALVPFVRPLHVLRGVSKTPAPPLEAKGAGGVTALGTLRARARRPSRAPLPARDCTGPRATQKRPAGMQGGHWRAWRPRAPSARICPPSPVGPQGKVLAPRPSPGAALACHVRRGEPPSCLGPLPHMLLQSVPGTASEPSRPPTGGGSRAPSATKSTNRGVGSKRS